MKTKSHTKEVSREYVFTERFLKETLGMEGEIMEIGLWEGRSPADEEQGIPKDDDKWFFKTKEGGGSE